MLRSLSACAMLAACAPSAPTLPIDSGDRPVKIAGHQSGVPIELVQEAARAELRRREQANCGVLTIPDHAFVPVEVTGGGMPEYAVFLSHARCDGAASYFTGTGGGVVQLWSAHGDAPILLMHHSMHGFTPTASGLVSAQHGAFCPGGAGPGMCLVTYDWRGPEDGFEVRSRRLYDYRHPGEPPKMTYGWNYPLAG